MATQCIQQISQSKEKEHILGIAILVAFLFPHSNTLFQLANPFLCLLLVFSFSDRRRWKPYVMMVLVPLLLSVLINSQVASQKAFLSTFAILLYFFCFPFVGKVRVRNVYLYICLGYIILSQLVYLLGIPFLFDFFNSAYPIGDNDTNYFEHMRSTMTYETITDYRLGGLYHNPNQCARYLCLLVAFFLVINQNDRKNRFVTIFSVIAYSGILLTGSRTGFVVASLILYFGLLRQKGSHNAIKYVFIGLVIMGIYHLIRSGVELRSFDVGSGFQNSAILKWDTFLYYLSSESSIVHLLLGHLDTSLFISGGANIMSDFDSEYGDLVFRFGIIGFIAILSFWWMTAKRIDKSYRFFFILLLWILSSTIVASYRAFFIFMLLLSVLYSNYGTMNKQIRHNHADKPTMGLQELSKN